MASTAILERPVALAPNADRVALVVDVRDHAHEVESWPVGRSADGEQVLVSECALCGELVDLSV